MREQMTCGCAASCSQQWLVFISRFLSLSHCSDLGRQLCGCQELARWCSSGVAGCFSHGGTHSAVRMIGTRFHLLLHPSHLLYRLLCVVIPFAELTILGMGTFYSEVRHPNVVQYFGVTVHSKIGLLLVMEHVRGPSLRSWLRNGNRDIRTLLMM